MEKMIQIPLEKYKKMVQELEKLRNMQKIDFDVERQIKEGLEDLKE